MTIVILLFAFCGLVAYFMIIGGSKFKTEKERRMEDIKNNKINTVIVKDLSRL